MQTPNFSSAVYIAISTSLVAGSLSACEPGSAFTKHSGHSEFGFKVAGKLAPASAVSFRPSPNPSTYSAYANYRQLLAMQAAAYRAARKPIKLAKALELRKSKLAARESRKAWVLAKQEVWKRAQSQDAFTPSLDLAGGILLATSNE